MEQTAINELMHYLMQTNHRDISADTLMTAIDSLKSQQKIKSNQFSDYLTHLGFVVGYKQALEDLTTELANNSDIQAVIEQLKLKTLTK